MRTADQRKRSVLSCETGSEEANRSERREGEAKAEPERSEAEASGERPGTCAVLKVREKQRRRESAGANEKHKQFPVTIA